MWKEAARQDAWEAAWEGQPKCELANEAAEVGQAFMVLSTTRHWVLQGLSLSRRHFGSRASRLIGEL